MITRKILEQYIYLEKSIESTKKKIKYYEEHTPAVIHGKVSGSSANFPFTEKTFMVSGPEGFEEYKRWREKVKALYRQYVSDGCNLAKSRIDIEEFINGIPELSTKLIFTYTFIDGMKQEDIARKLSMEQSTISKRITKYLEDINTENVAI